MAERLEIDLSRDRYDMVQHAVADGRYDSPSAVVDEALALLEKQREQELIEEVKRLVAQAEESGYQPWEGAEALNREFREKYGHLIQP
jgi:putative addiction module CopG family antidote